MKSSDTNFNIPYSMYLLRSTTREAVRTFTRGRKCPRCTGRIKRDWLYCRNSVNHWRNLCGWKPGKPSTYTGEAGIKQVVGPEQKGTTFQPYGEEYTDSDRP